MLQLTWRIYYSDGSTFDNSDGEPSEAPQWGFVCAIGYEQDGGRYIMQGWDFYRWDSVSAQWWGLDWAGVLDLLVHGIHVEGFKIGRTVPKLQWQSLMSRANRDPDFPKVVADR